MTKLRETPYFVVVLEAGFFKPKCRTRTVSSAGLQKLIASVEDENLGGKGGGGNQWRKNTGTQGSYIIFLNSDGEILEMLVYGTLILL